MNNGENNLKPIKRSKCRLITGKIYYTLSRYLLWYSGKFKFANYKVPNYLDYEYFSHKTPLLRELEEVDMQYQYNKIIY